MVDLVDRAQELEQFQRDNALANALRPDQLLEAADNCIDCDDMIPSMRQAAVPGTQYCVRCAERHEANTPAGRRSMVIRK